MEKTAEPKAIARAGEPRWFLIGRARYRARCKEMPSKPRRACPRAE